MTPLFPDIILQIPLSNVLQWIFKWGTFPKKILRDFVVLDEKIEYGTGFM